MANSSSRFDTTGNSNYEDFLVTLQKQEAYIRDALESDTKDIESGKISILRAVERKQYYTALLNKYTRQLSKDKALVTDGDSFEELESITDTLSSLVDMWDKAISNKSTSLLKATDVGSVAATAGRGLKDLAKNKLISAVDSITSRNSVTRSLTSAIANRTTGGNAITRALRGSVGLTAVARDDSAAHIQGGSPSSSDVMSPVQVNDRPSDVHKPTETEDRSSSDQPSSNTLGTRDVYIPDQVMSNTRNTTSNVTNNETSSSLSNDTESTTNPVQIISNSTAVTDFSDAMTIQTSPSSVIPMSARTTQPEAVAPNMSNVFQFPSSARMAEPGARSESTTSYMREATSDLSHTVSSDNVIPMTSPSVPVSSEGIKPEDLPDSFDYTKFFEMRGNQVEDQWIIESLFLQDEFENLRKEVDKNGGGGGGVGLLGTGIAAGIGGIVTGVLGKVKGAAKLLKGRKGKIGLAIGAVAALGSLFSGDDDPSVDAVSNPSDATSTPSTTASLVEGSLLNTGAGKKAANALTSKSITPKPAGSAASSVTKSIPKGVGGALSKVLGPIGYILSAYDAWSDAEALYAKNQGGKISDDEFSVGLGKIIGGMLGGLGGAALLAKLGAAGGALVGSIIPGAGTLAGGVLGGLVGGAVGFVAGDYVGEEIGAAIAGIAFTDTSDTGIKSGKPSSSLTSGEHELGQLSAKYESKGDYGAIGNDKTGGFSYGKYQLASKQGSVKKFIEHVRKNNPEVAEKLDAAGGNQGAVRGTQEFQEVWKTLSEDRVFQELQQDFVSSQYLDPVVKGVGEFGLDPDNLSDTLKDVLFSTSVQHGVGGTRSVLRAVSNGESLEGVSESDLIERIYNERSTRFQSSTSKVQNSVRARFIQENSDAQAMLVSEAIRDQEEQVSSITEGSSSAIPVSERSQVASVSPVVTSVTRQGLRRNRKDAMVDTGIAGEGVLSSNVQPLLMASNTSTPEDMVSSNTLSPRSVETVSTSEEPIVARAEAIPVAQDSTSGSGSNRSAPGSVSQSRRGVVTPTYGGGAEDKDEIPMVLSSTMGMSVNFDMTGT